MRVEQNPPLITVLVDGHEVLTGQVRDSALLDLVRPRRGRRVWVLLAVAAGALLVVTVLGALAGVQ